MPPFSFGQWPHEGETDSLKDLIALTAGGRDRGRILVVAQHFAQLGNATRARGNRAGDCAALSPVEMGMGVHRQMVLTSHCLVLSLRYI